MFECEIIISKTIFVHTLFSITEHPAWLAFQGPAPPLGQGQPRDNRRIAASWSRSHKWTALAMSLTPSSSSTSLASSCPPDLRHRHLYFHQYRRHHYSSSSDSADWASSSAISYAPSPSQRLARHFRWGWYVNFKPMLIPVDAPPPAWPASD